MEARIEAGKMTSWQIGTLDEELPLVNSEHATSEAKIALARNFEWKVPLSWLLATPVMADATAAWQTLPIATKLRLRFSIWQNRLPVDALPLEGWIELQLLSEPGLAAHAF
jgi:hypothetical protein